jgi:hypothetical protein
MIRHWVERGTNGFRLFTGGSTAAFDPSTLDDPRSFPSWRLIGELGVNGTLRRAVARASPM